MVWEAKADSAQPPSIRSRISLLRFRRSGCLGALLPLLFCGGTREAEVAKATGGTVHTSIMGLRGTGGSPLAIPFSLLTATLLLQDW